MGNVLLDAVRSGPTRSRDRDLGANTATEEEGNSRGRTMERTQVAFEEPLAVDLSISPAPTVSRNPAAKSRERSALGRFGEALKLDGGEEEWKEFKKGIVN